MDVNYIFFWFIDKDHIYCVCMRAKWLQSCLTLANIWNVARQAPLSMGFSRQECWSTLPCSPPGDLFRPRDRTQVSYVFCIDRWVLYH